MSDKQPIKYTVTEATLADLTPQTDEENTRKHNPRNIGMIAESLQEVGTLRSVVVDENNKMIGGSGTWEAASQTGVGERVLIIDAPPDVLIARRRNDLDEEKKIRAALYDNRSAELAEYNPLRMLELRKTGPELLAGMFNKVELDAIVAPAFSQTDVQGGKGKGGDEFLLGGYDGPRRAHRGDIWQIGPHRLRCGDSRVRGEIEALMQGQVAPLLATDPPYNVGKDYAEAQPDSMSDDEYAAWTAWWMEHWGAYSERQIITPSRGQLGMWLHIFKPAQIGVWLTLNAMTRGTVTRFSTWEPILFFGEGWKRERANDVFDYPITVQRFADGQSMTRMHPNPKPLALFQDFIEHYSNPRDIIADPFAGTGTTLIGAHRTGRVCYAQELSPAYCDVILSRALAEGISPVERIDGAPHYEEETEEEEATVEA